MILPKPGKAGEELRKFVEGRNSAATHAAHETQQREAAPTLMRRRNSRRQGEQRCAMFGS
eukprot:3934303-Rhodomonas_salina.2